MYADVPFDASYSVEATVYDDHDQSSTVTVVFNKAAEFDTLVVDIAHDESDGNFEPGDLSLREAIELANSNPGRETIVFAADLSGSTIALDGSLGPTGDRQRPGLGGTRTSPWMRGAIPVCCSSIAR